MSCVLSHLQITDLISVFYGSPTPLNQVQRPLREFLSTRVMHGLAPFPDNIRTSVQDLVNSMQQEIQETVVRCLKYLSTFTTYCLKFLTAAAVLKAVFKPKQQFLIEDKPNFIRIQVFIVIFSNFGHQYLIDRLQK